MSKNRRRAFAVISLLTLACCTTATARKRQTIERGMTKQQVTAILGKPITTGFNSYGDRWMYEVWSGPVIGGCTVRAYVLFDTTGKVVGYDEQPYDPHQPEISTSRPFTNVAPVPMPYPAERHCLSDASFTLLYNKVKGAHFDSERKDLIEVASLGCYYSCNQCAQILKIFSFDNDRMSMLKLMASHITDPQNAPIVCQQFTFDDAKRQATQIILGE